MRSKLQFISRRWLLLLGTIVLVVFGILWVWPWYKQHFRPMFWCLQRAEDEHIAPWTFEFITADQFGSFAIPDRHLNLLLVVVAPPEAGGESFWSPAWGSLIKSADRNRAIVQFDPAGSRSVAIRRTTDAMIVALPDGTQLRAPLKAGEAVRLFTEVQAVHLLGEPTGKTILSSIEDAVGPGNAEIRTILKEALKRTQSEPATTSAPTSVSEAGYAQRRGLRQATCERGM